MTLKPGQHKEAFASCIKIEIRKCFLIVYIQSIISYGYENWAVCKEEKQQIEAFKNGVTED